MIMMKALRKVTNVCFKFQWGTAFSMKQHGFLRAKPYDALGDGS